MASFLQILFDALNRIRRRKEPPYPPSGTPTGFSQNAFPPSGRWKTFDLPPEDVEFLQEIGLPPEDLEEPFEVPNLGTAQAIPSDTLDLIRAGVWMHGSSSNVDAWRFNEKAGAIDVRFLSGSEYSYANCTINNAIQFAGSPSMGRYVWYVFRANPQRYPATMLRDANRMQKVNPRTGKGYVVFKPRTAWRYRSKSTGKTVQPPYRPWP